MKQLKAIVFDAYGTLFNISSLDDRLHHYYGKKSPEIAATWRKKQLEYTWLRTLMEKYEPFSKVTADALQYACRQHVAEFTRDILDDMMLRYQVLSAYPEVVDVLDQLKRKHHLAVLSNADFKMLKSAVDHNQLSHVFDRVISVDVMNKFKPVPSVYQLAISGLEVDKEYIAFVSTNTWDVAGAKSFGFKTIWLNRNNTITENLDFDPDWTITSLQELLS
ncbi:haloacid dehalogenase type II [Fulvivirgaceae bacterium BMA12]|uniref:Haloacid dehalogenase type II n=1 Tax=Agaribacillus aureus TaxID=3051825 RepID=A0ABT8L2H7_9BACT|nr:haloacid dehalogenase type II [Fulvivirgaceae bacterium BMA12]